MPLGVRVALARYYSSVGDAQTVALAEALLGELDQKPKASDPWPQLWGVIFLAQYHEKAGQWQKAGETWERALGYQGEVMWWQAGVRVDAARAYKQTDTPEGQAKAKELYAQAKKQGDEGMMGMAIYDQALFMVNDKPTQARDLVLQQLPTLPNTAARIGPLWALAQAQWKLEAWPEAEAALQQMLQVCPQKPAYDSQAVIIEAAKTELQTLQEWKTKTFVLPLHNLLSRSDENGIYHVTLYVHSFKPQPIGVRFTDSEVRLNALTLQRQQRSNSGVLVAIYDLSYSTSHPANSIAAFVELKNQPEATQQIVLQRSE